MTLDDQLKTCELCRRRVRRVTKHHLVPRSRIKKRKRRGQTEQSPEFEEVIALLCSPCHKMIHAVLSEKELERDYDTINSLLAHTEIGTFVQWVRKQPDGHVKVRWTNHRRAGKASARK